MKAYLVDRFAESSGHDVLAGLVLTAFLVPVGMGYAQASGVPPVHGLYATIVPLLIYAFLGPSRVLVLGPDSSLAPIIAATILPLAGGDIDRAVMLAGALAIGSGLICVAAGLARFGFLSELLSMPVRYGYLNGIAIAVIASQLPAVLGVAGSAETPLGRIDDAFDGVRAGAVGGASLLLGVGSVLVLVATARWLPRLPGVLIAVVLATVAVAVFGLADEVAVVGRLPRGLPSIGIPTIDRGDLGAIAAGSFTLAVLTFTDTGTLSKAYALRNGEVVDTNRELLALGAANLATGVAQGFPVSASSSRTPVAESAGATTQLAGIVAAGGVTAVLIAAPGVFTSLPTSALAAVVIVAVVGLIEWHAVVQLWRQGTGEFWLSVLATLGVVILGALWGIGVAVLMSLIAFVERSRRPHTTTLVRLDGVKGYHDANRHREGREIDGLLLYRFDAPLFFANADLFRSDLVGRLDTLEQAGRPIRWVTVTAEPITSIDATADAMLRSLAQELHERSILLTFAELKGVVRDRLDRAGTTKIIGDKNFFPTIGRAVNVYVRTTDSDWVDWQDQDQDQDQNKDQDGEQR